MKTANKSYDFTAKEPTASGRKLNFQVKGKLESKRKSSQRRLLENIATSEERLHKLERENIELLKKYH